MVAEYWSLPREKTVKKMYTAETEIPTELKSVGTSETKIRAI
jgi:hypothetical protein